MIVFIAAFLYFWCSIGFIVFASIARSNARDRGSAWAGLNDDTIDKVSIFLLTVSVWPIILFLRYRD